ncbi:MAG TPA: hypothetical protein VMB22_01765, partial [Verrucomicrobiae bacterium]|nr:hypothetical protein [Verrucomicrobiae bacterium]
MKIFIRWLKWITHFFVWIWQLAKFFTPWLEWVAMVAAVLVTLVAANEMFLANSQETGQAKYDILSYSEFQQRATVLGNESDPIKRDAMCIGLSALGRSLDAQLPTNSRVFLAGMLGETNAGNLGYYYFLSDYLFPREVAISVGAPPKFTFNGFTGQDPTNLDELKDAGYDLVLGVASNGQLESKMLNPFTPRQEEPPPIPGGDPIVAFLLPLAVALAGT